MKLLKKGISLILVAVLVLSLAACGQGSQTDASSQGATSNNTSSEGKGNVGSFFVKFKVITARESLYKVMYTAGFCRPDHIFFAGIRT